MHSINRKLNQMNKKQNSELMNTDPGKWLGPFYFNKEDSRIMVPKLNPELGGTFNRVLLDQSFVS